MYCSHFLRKSDLDFIVVLMCNQEQGNGGMVFFNVAIRVRTVCWPIYSGHVMLIAQLTPVSSEKPLIFSSSLSVKILEIPSWRRSLSVGS